MNPQSHEAVEKAYTNLECMRRIGPLVVQSQVVSHSNCRCQSFLELTTLGEERQRTKEHLEEGVEKPLDEEVLNKRKNCA